VFAAILGASVINVHTKNGYSGGILAAGTMLSKAPLHHTSTFQGYFQAYRKHHLPLKSKGYKIPH